MKTLDIDSQTSLQIPGLVHRTIAGSKSGLTRGEAWIQTVAPGAGTPLHKHDCEEIVIMLSGSVLCRNELGEECRVGAMQSVTFEPNVVHEIINDGSEPATGIAFFTMTPVRVQDPSGAIVPLPWD